MIMAVSTVKKENAIYTAAANSNVAVSTSAWKTITTLVLQPGIYIVVGDIWFASNSTGIRVLYLDTTEGSSNDHNTSVLGTGRSDLSKTRVFSLTAQTTIYLRGWQTTGADLNAKGKITAVKLA